MIEEVRKLTFQSFVSRRIPCGRINANAIEKLGDADAIALYTWTMTKPPGWRLDHDQAKKSLDMNTARLHAALERIDACGYTMPDPENPGKSFMCDAHRSTMKRIARREIDRGFNHPRTDFGASRGETGTESEQSEIRPAVL